VRRDRAASQRGQAFIELALAVPILVVLALGTVDLGRAFYANLPVAGMASVGAEVGAGSNVNDIGATIRQESNVVPNTSVAWGADLFTGGTNAQCSTTPNLTTYAQSCGDPYGCQTSGTHNAFTSASRVACYAVGMCTAESSAHNGVCTQPAGITWQARPPAGATASTGNANGALVVKVVYVFTPLTPLVKGFYSATGNLLYLSQTSVITEEY
jgi:Flp pilus assembly protein TadG